MVADHPSLNSPLQDDPQFQAAILGAIRDGVNIVSRDGIILYTNTAFERMFGYGPGELLGQHVAILNAPTPRPPEDVAAEIIQAINCHNEWQGDIFNRRKDGSVFWTRARVSKMQSVLHGEVWISSRHEVTAERRDRAALKANEERLSLALEGSGLVFWDWDIAAREIFADTRWYQMLGYSPDDLGRNEDAWFALIHPQDIDLVRHKLSECLAGNVELYQAEFRLRHRAGHWAYLEATGKVFQRESDGTPLRLVGTILDVSQRKRLNELGVSLLKQIECLLRGSSPSVSIPDEDNALAESLTRRQRQTIALIAKGMTSAEIAKALNISIGTAIGHRRDLMKKLDLHSTAEVTRFAVRHKLAGE